MAALDGSRNQARGFSFGTAEKPHIGVLRDYHGVPHGGAILRRMRALTLESLLADLRHALHLLLRHRGFTAAAITALALAIGANVTVFTLANAFLFKNLPFDDSDRIVYLSTATPVRPAIPRGASYPDFVDFRAQMRSLEELAAFQACSVDVSDGRSLPERYRCAQLTPNAFHTVGQMPSLGRDFREEDTVRGAPPVAILGHAMWLSRYAGDRSIVGTTIRINDVPTTVIGVMPAGMTFPGASDMWLPLVQTDAMRRRNARPLTMFGRMKPQHGGIGWVRSEAVVVAARLAAQYPETNKDVLALVQNFNDRFNGGQTTRVLVWLMWAVAFVLVIACANVANLLLARAVGRSREMSIRASLGASRAQVVQQLLVESFLLAALAAAFGWLLGMWGVQVFDAALVPAVKPPHIDFSIDWRVVAFLAGVTVVTALAFGLAPALQLSAIDINASLKDGGNAAGQGRAARFVSTSLVVAEVALAVILLAGAGLMVRSLLNTNRADIGIDPVHILSMNMNLRATKYPRVDSHLLFYDRLKARLEALPGVEVAAIASDLPAESPDVFTYEVDGGPAIVNTKRPRAAGLVVGEGYFQVMGVKPRAGRDFDQSDTPGGVRSVVINEMLARQAWPEQPAVGKRLRILSSEDSPNEAGAPGPWLTVVGVVRDILQDDESFELSPVIYLPYRQQPQRGMEIVVRTNVPTASVGEAIRREVQVMDPDLAVRTLRPLQESLWLRNWRHRVFGTMFAIFAVIAVVLASVGLYAVIAHSVSLRTREFGVRMTLGASGANILGLVFQRGMTELAVGLMIGLPAALAATRVLEAMLVGVQPGDPATFAAAASLLILAGVLGCAVPARRALRVDPVIALRNE